MSCFEGLPKENRWVKLDDSLPWDKIESICLMNQLIFELQGQVVRQIVIQQP